MFWSKKMGSRKLILLPQALSILTWYSANHVFPIMLHLVLPNSPMLDASLAGTAYHARAQPNLVQHLVSLCPALPSHIKRCPCGLCLTCSCQARPCSTPSLTLSCLVFLCQVQPLRIFPDIVIIGLTLLDSVFRSVLPCFSRLNSTFARFIQPSHAVPDLP